MTVTIFFSSLSNTYICSTRDAPLNYQAQNLKRLRISKKKYWVEGKNHLRFFKRNLFQVGGSTLNIDRGSTHNTPTPTLFLSRINYACTPSNMNCAIIFFPLSSETFTLKITMCYDASNRLSAGFFLRAEKFVFQYLVYR